MAKESPRTVAAAVTPTVVIDRQEAGKRDGVSAGDHVFYLVSPLDKIPGTVVCTRAGNCVDIAINDVKYGRGGIVVTCIPPDKYAKIAA